MLRVVAARPVDTVGLTSPDGWTPHFTSTVSVWRGLAGGMMKWPTNHPRVPPAPSADAFPTRMSLFGWSFMLPPAMSARGATDGSSKLHLGLTTERHRY